MNKIVRVNRGPTVASSEDEFNKGIAFLKSPAYQLRFRPNNRMSQFHSYPVLNGLTPSSSGLNIFNIPGMSSQNSNNQNAQGRLEEIESSEPNEKPTFTPFISARFVIKLLPKYTIIIMGNYELLTKVTSIV